MSFSSASAVIASLLTADHMISKDHPFICFISFQYSHFAYFTNMQTFFFIFHSHLSRFLCIKWKLCIETGFRKPPFSLLLDFVSASLNLVCCVWTDFLESDLCLPYDLWVQINPWPDILLSESLCVDQPCSWCHWDTIVTALWASLILRSGRGRQWLVYSNLYSSLIDLFFSLIASLLFFSTVSVSI